MEKMFTGFEKVGEIVSAFPGSSYLFMKCNIDFCCGGNQMLLTVLHQQNMDEQQFITNLNQIYNEAIRDNDGYIDWNNIPSADLIDYIINTHHDFLRRELPLLKEIVAEALRMNGPVHGDVHLKLYRLYYRLKMEFEHHLVTEEAIVFPLIKQYEKNPSSILLFKVFKAIDSIKSDHANQGKLLKEMREVISDYELLMQAYPAYTLAFEKLEELESDIFQHIHLENNILFPRITQCTYKQAIQ